jgi:hypothetical protein
LQLTDLGFKFLLSYLDVPLAFGKKLRNDGNGHVLSYLQKQLSNAHKETISMVLNTETEEVMSFTEDPYIPFRGTEALTLDQRLHETLKKDICPFELKMNPEISEDGTVIYTLMLKEPSEVSADQVMDGEQKVKPLWKWGYQLKHSVLGADLPFVSTSLLRMVCTNLSYLAQKQFRYPIQNKNTLEERWQEVENFLLTPPKAQWDKLNSWLHRLGKANASLAEVKDVRKQLLAVVKVDKEDIDSENRINGLLQWDLLKKAYRLDELEEKPSRQWYQRAATPLNLLHLYNSLTQEGTHLPNTVSVEKRQKLLVYGGKLLTKQPDLKDEPPVVNWDSVHLN